MPIHYISYYFISLANFFLQNKAEDYGLLKQITIKNLSKFNYTGDLDVLNFMEKHK